MRLVRFMTAALVTLAGLTIGCADESEWPAPCPGTLESTGGAPNILEPALPDVTAPGGGIEMGQPGAPCAVNADCATNFCMTTETIGTLIPGTSVQGGYCSELMCPVDGESGLCGSAEIGGICFSLVPFVPDWAENGICLAPCEEDRDCRPEDDIICFDAQSLVVEGLLEQEVLDRYYPTASAGCLSRSLVAAAIESLQE